MKKINSLLLFVAIASLMCGCSNEIKDNNGNSINIVASISSEDVARSPILDETGKGNFMNGDIFTLAVSNSENDCVLNDFIVGTSDLKWDDLNISSGNGKLIFSACYPKQNIKDGKFTFNISTSDEKDLLLAQVGNVAVNSNEPINLNFRHAMHKLVILYTTDEDMDITTQCTALSTCEVDLTGNNLSVKGDSKFTSSQSGKNISFFVVPQRTSDITLNVNYGNKSKSFSLDEYITNYDVLEGGKIFTLKLDIKNGDIQIEDPVIGNWGDQGSVNDDIIM